MRTVEAAGLAIGPGAPTRIMGVVNVSARSPYEPSVTTAADDAAERIDDLVDEGADIVDVGLSTANKRYEPLSVEAELDRLAVAADAIASASRSAVYSIETRYHEVAAAALDRGFEMVNDVCGFADPEMPRVCADHDVAVVKMASPPDLSRPGALESVRAIHEALARGGFTDKTIVDPAFGGWSEGKTLADDRETFRRLSEFRAYRRPILVSINRKNFLRELAGRSTEKALPVSLAATALAVERGASVVRTHDVAATRDAAVVGDDLGDERLVREGDVDVIEFDAPPASTLRAQLRRSSADPARAADWTWRAFELAGLGDEAPWLRDRLADAGVQVQGEDPMVLAGSTRTLRRIQRVVGDAPPEIADALEAVVAAAR
ncbi:MAG: dihydropteroate synthase [Halobacteriales archaeon]